MRFENIIEDFKTVQNHFQCFEPLPHANISNHKNYRDYYNNELKDLIYKKYEKDIKLFNYEF